jgi:hypothetical protein
VIDNILNCFNENELLELEIDEEIKDINNIIELIILNKDKALKIWKDRVFSQINNGIDPDF